MTFSTGTIPYASIWQSLNPPNHEIAVFMCYNFYSTGPKYFTMAVGGDGRSKLLSEEFIKTYYKMKEKK